jgi:hypothetical protein
MRKNVLSFDARKALSVNLGEAAGSEIASVIMTLAKQVEELQKNKVSVTRIVASRDSEDAYSEPK